MRGEARNPWILALLSLAACADTLKLPMTEVVGDAGFDSAPPPDDATTPDAVRHADWPDVTFNGHLYVGIFDERRGGLAVFASPLSARSAPSLLLTAANGITGAFSIAMTPDLARLFVADGVSYSILAFDLPLAANSQPAFTLRTPNPPPNGVAFDADGHMWVAGSGGEVDEYVPPITATSMPARRLEVMAGDINLFAIAFAPEGALVATGANSGVAVFQPPFADHAQANFVMTPRLRYQGLAFHGGNLYATGFYDGFFSFVPPFSGSSFPDQQFRAGGYLSDIVFAPAGQVLLARDDADGGVVVYDLDTSQMEFTVSANVVHARGLIWGP
jgi:hypothetical protein